MAIKLESWASFAVWEVERSSCLNNPLVNDPEDVLTPADLGIFQNLLVE